jgi:23S rRNA (adenine2030-N6)-methyltransferase
LNYRHVHHAGNFADLVKHAVLLHLLAAATARAQPLFLLDTHAGAGVYALADSRTGEAAAGVARLMDRRAPAVFDPLKRAVTRLNGGGPVRSYPGSPRLIADALRPADEYVACELRPDDHAQLQRTLAGAPAEALRADGYLAVRNLLPVGHANALVLIDPPYERGDEYAQAVAAVGAALARSPVAQVCLWAPLKDLETFDRLVRELEALDPPDLLLVECRLRPLIDPLKLNGCALALVNAPAELEPGFADIADWTAEVLGDPGGEGRVWRA